MVLMATTAGRPWTWKTDAIYSQACCSSSCDNKLHTEVTVWAVETFMCDVNLLKYHRTWYTGSSLDLCKGTNGRTEPPPAWMSFQDRYLDGKAAFWEDASCHCWGWGGGRRGDGCWKTKWLAGKRGGNLGFLGLCQGSPADRMATAEGPCCEGGFSFLLKGKRGAPSQPLLPLITSSFSLSWLPGEVYLTVSFEKHLHPALKIISIPSLHTLSSLYFHFCDGFIYIVMHSPAPYLKPNHLNQMLFVILADCHLVCCATTRIYIQMSEEGQH